ncbi:hypothetical protein AJ80_04050 [Polytolypa hystricis UAMH7299]|uniref:Mitochondrial glyco protein n=1 Tax=Polytolypa hystricis (strain UAMH7299) TaxID=1447883 RepID=A0A2B7YFB2_POLH7|nr:hypothetical protein AJ80_04050 [Polytolypa hystricis UAMH7299]
MFSLRAFSRSVPRTFSRSLTTSSVRPLRSIQKPALLQSAWIRAPRHTYPAFSTSVARFAPAGDVDVELAAKVQDEIALENEGGETDVPPESVQQYLDDSQFELHEKSGEEEVVLTRTFGNEKIRVSFTIADLQNLQDEAEFEDQSFQDEYGDMSPEAINQDGKKGSKITIAPEDKVSPADREGEAFEEESEPSYPARVNITIEKAGKGAVHFETVAQDGFFVIENVFHFAKPELANAETAEKEWARQSLYAGPPFGNLDQDLQDLWDRYLEERGVDTALATFVPDFIDYKEQKEYVRWLGGMLFTFPVHSGSGSR